MSLKHSATRYAMLAALWAVLSSCFHATATGTRPPFAATPSCSALDSLTEIARERPSPWEGAPRLPGKLICALEAWGALPPWVLQTTNSEWLELLHRNVTMEGWPEDLRAARAEMVERRGLYLGRSIDGHDQHLITMSRAIPAHLEELFQIVARPLIEPAAGERDRKMRIDQRRRSEAAADLAELIGMLEHTSYIDSDEAIWRPEVIFAARFIYYHELGHLTSFCLENSCSALDLLAEEEDLSEEMRADLVAFSLLALELRNQDPDLFFVGFSGISLAMCLMGAQEFATPYTVDLRRTRTAVLRMARLQHWTTVGIEADMLPSESIRGLRFWWDPFNELLREVNLVPSPILRLLAETADGPEEEWLHARNEIVKWVAFGDSERIVAGVSAVYQNAVARSAKEARARRVVALVRYIVAETKFLEPELGLEKVLS